MMPHGHNPILGRIRYVGAQPLCLARVRRHGSPLGIQVNEVDVGEIEGVILFGSGRNTTRFTVRGEGVNVIVDTAAEIGPLVIPASGPEDGVGEMFRKDIEDGFLKLSSVPSL
jgi:hypothetical protein